jgi:hypothetical protein
VLVPCYNEQTAIAKVVRDFRAALPEAQIYVYDNNSTDKTAETAREAGATVRTETLQGKGNVVRRMFADVEADVYVLVDGDATYLANDAPRFVSRLLREDLDMVTGVRKAEAAASYRRGHAFGNWLLTAVVANIFGPRCGDMLSGYRVFSRRFVKSFPALTTGFEIETELTVHALQLQMPISDETTRYCERAPGSTSKLRTFRDGVNILITIANLVRDERPLQFFTLVAVLLFGTAVLLAYPIFVTYAETGLVPRFPTAILATGLVILASLSFAAGVVLDSISRGRRELKRLRYLEIPVYRRQS